MLVERSLLAAMFLAAASAHATTHYVANNGDDSTFCGLQVINGFTCGAKATPCRSIQCAIREADPGDTIIVGPGRYGDLNADGDLADRGDEFGSSGCGCMVSVTKSLRIVSSAGAASTVIDARSVSVDRNVLILASGEFGQSGKGFTVTSSKRQGGHGIEIEGPDVKIRGNQAVATLVQPFSELQPLPGTGIRAFAGGTALIEGNQVLGQWSWSGIAAGGTKTVRKNQVSVTSSIGVFAEGGAVVLGNIVSGANIGIDLVGAASAFGNAVLGAGDGIHASDDGLAPFSGLIQRNNLMGSRFCGVLNEGESTLNATSNYWGVATGPGPGPADDVCNADGLTTITTPFATKPFPVSAPIRP